MNNKKVLCSLIALTSILSCTFAPYSNVAKAQNNNQTQQDSSTTSIDRYVHVDSKSKQYVFDKRAYENKTNTSKQEANEIQNNINKINEEVHNAKHVTIENDKIVTYMTDEEVNQEMQEQGISKKEINKATSTYKAKKGGVNKVIYDKKGGFKLYLSHNTTSKIVNVGAVAAANIIGPIFGKGITAAMNIANAVIGNFSNHVIPKNGIIITGKVDGSVQKINRQ